jgi:hypothetical protein
MEQEVMKSCMRNGWRRTGGEIKGWMERLLDEK